MEDMIYDLERESGEPEDWEGDAVFERDGKGRIAKIDIPDDIEEVVENAGYD